MPQATGEHHADTLAVVFGAGGGIGRSLVSALWDDARFDKVLGFSRSTNPAIDLLDEASLKHAASHLAQQGVPRLVIDATGFLHNGGQRPEKSWRELDHEKLARAFAINASGPALLMKHVLPRLPREGRSVFATLSARVGSIGDNQLGGWYGYRASKAALNQIVRTAAIELVRTAPEALCVALHPGTVATPLSGPFARGAGRAVSPDQAAQHLLAVVDGLEASKSGGFYDWRGEVVPW